MIINSTQLNLLISENHHGQKLRRVVKTGRILAIGVKSERRWRPHGELAPTENELRAGDGSFANILHDDSQRLFADIGIAQILQTSMKVTLYCMPKGSNLNGNILHGFKLFT